MEMYVINKDRLKQKALDSIGLDISDYVDDFELFATRMAQYNERINLTRILQPEDIEDKHFIDCLQVATLPFMTGKVCDVGSGAGFPGLVIAIVRRDVSVTLIEPTEKRCKFLREIARELHLDNVTVVNGRAEELARKEHREVYSCVTARAVASLSTLLEYCLPLCKKGGKTVAMKGSIEEPKDGKTACEVLGGVFNEEIKYSLPQGDERRLFIFDKVRKTPSEYPRNGGRIAKKPL